MAKLIILAIAVATFFAGCLCDPVFLLSNRKIDDVASTSFFDTASFADLLKTEFLSQSKIPSNIFIFNVKVQDKSLLQSSSLLLREINNFPSLKKNFQGHEKVFSSVYVKDAFTVSFDDVLTEVIQRKGFNSTKLALGKFSFERVLNLNQAKNQSVLSLVDLQISELSVLANLFEKEFPGFATNNNFLVILKFIDDRDNYVPTGGQTVVVPGRMLQEEQPAENTAGGTPATAGDEEKTVIPIGPQGLTGFVIAITLFLILYGIVQVLDQIRVPVKFSKEPLQIGKELL